MKEEKKIIRVGELDIKGWHRLAKEVIFEGGGVYGNYHTIKQPTSKGFGERKR